MAHRLGSFPL